MAIETCGPNNSRRLLKSYSRLDETCSEVLVPDDASELARMLIQARDRGRKVTLRAGGWSLHNQSLNHDLVISMEKLDRIEPVDVAHRRVTVGAAATWSEVVDATLAHELIPYVVPTGEDITCGGSLAADAISRYSPSFGSESLHVERLEFLAVGEEAPRWIGRPGPDDDGPDARLFRAIVGGFGYLGAVTRITYRLLSLQHVGGPLSRNQKVRVSTRLYAHEKFEDLLADITAKLIDDVQQTLDIDLDEFDIPEEPDPFRFPAVYAVAFPDGKLGRGAIYKSFYSRGDVGDPYIIYRPHEWWRKWITWILTSSTLKKLINTLVWRSMKSDSDAETLFVNDIKDYMFFMQGQVIGKQSVEDVLNKPLPLLQQTFVVPLEDDHPTKFMQDMTAILEDHDIEPTLFEFLFMPKDRVLMSASNGTTGYAITVAFQDIESKRRQERAIQALRAISHRLWHGYRGRIHLTKNVYADPDVLEKMFGDHATQFLALKNQYDPEGVLRNCFFERLFPTVANDPKACPDRPS